MRSLVSVSAILGIVFVVSVLGTDDKEARIVPDEDMLGKLRRYFTRTELPFQSPRHPIVGYMSRTAMATNIGLDLQILKIQADRNQIRNSLEVYNFTTTINYQNGDKQVAASNYIFILHANETTKMSDDKPILLLANYDTAPDSNFVNDGSGLVALLTLISIIIKEIGTEKHILQHSIIFAFTDASVQKYNTQHIPGSISGARSLTDSWLPSYLNLDNSKRQFRGAIVLDNVMNYRGEADTQIVDGSMDKSFPTAYRNILDQGKKGDFVGLVSRDDDYDRPLAKAFADAWQESRKQLKAVPTVDPRIVPFTFSRETFISPSADHFLKSEQYAFWRSHTDNSAKLYPAILITDTRSEYRRAPCNLQCRVEDMLTENNLSFLLRTVQTLRNMILDSQTNANGALPGVQISIFALILSVALALWRNY